jgi:hypothetical protein
MQNLKNQEYSSFYVTGVIQNKIVVLPRRTVKKTDDLQSAEPSGSIDLEATNKLVPSGFVILM